MAMHTLTALYCTTTTGKAFIKRKPKILAENWGLFCSLIAITVLFKVRAHSCFWITCYSHYTDWTVNQTGASPEVE